MPKTPPPVLGFNNNVRHQGRVFHIQTEDSGVKRPHIITHLFGDGGRILKSLRTDYSEHVGRDDTAAVVRKMMKEQHKALFIALRRGELDDVIEQAFGPPPVPPASKVEAPSPEPVPAADALAAPAGAAVDAPATDAAGAAVAPNDVVIIGTEREPPPTRPEPIAASAQAQREAAPSPVVTPPPSRAAPKTPSAATPAAALGEAPVVPGGFTPKPAPISNRPPREEMPRRGTPALGTPKVARPPSDPNAGRYSATPPAIERVEPPASAGRYSVSRPAAIFGDAPPKEAKSIFGDDVIGEKSLDEVILSYLAEDLESPPQK